MILTPCLHDPINVCHLPSTLAGLVKLKCLHLAANHLHGLKALHETVFTHLPLLSDLSLGANKFDMAATFAMPGPVDL